MAININPFARGQTQARQAAIGRQAVSPERLALMRESNKIPGIRVVPVNEAMRKVLVHAPSGRKLRSEGSTEWPNDRFTQRRLADGDIKLEEVEKKEEGHKEHESHKEHSTRGRATSGS